MAQEKPARTKKLASLEARSVRRDEAAKIKGGLGKPGSGTTGSDSTEQSTGIGR